MSRLARLEAPGVFHHVIIRGIERWNIFEDNIDRDNLLDRLADLLPATKKSCYAWAFLSNHAHFLIRFFKRRKKVRTDSRGLYCFWAVTELGCGQKELAKKLSMTQPGVRYAVIRGEAISKSNHLELKK
jgi:hypothetical protein